MTSNKISNEQRDKQAKLLKSRFYDALSESAFQRRFTAPSFGRALYRLIKVLGFTIISYHLLYILPMRYVPIGWGFVCVAMIWMFEIGQDCYNHHFFQVPILDNFVYYVCLMPLLHVPEEQLKVGNDEEPIEFSNIDKRLPSWHQRKFSDWSILAAVVLPSCIYNWGIYDVGKYWLAPCLMFHIWMMFFTYMGRTLAPRIVDLLLHQVHTSSTSNNWLWVTWQSILRHTGLRAVLHFIVKVPTYRLTEATTAVYRMWDRRMMDEADGPSVNKEQDKNGKERAVKKWWAFHENMAVGAFKRGISHFPYLDWGTQGIMLLLIFVWLWIYAQRQAILAGKEATVQWIWWGSLSNQFRTQIGVPLANLTQNIFVDSDYVVVNWLILVVFITILFRQWAYADRPVYLVDFVTFTGSDSNKVTIESFQKLQRLFDFSPEALSFMDRLIKRTGLGNSTYFPTSILSNPPDFSMNAAREEAETVMFGCLDELFANTRVSPRSIDILVVNCSLFCPTPSLASMIVNHYNMREDIESYNLGGMGCSAGVISIHLVRQLLQARPNSTAVVVSTENITQNWYRGESRSMLVANCLFRMGAAAIMLSNKSEDYSRSKYKLLQTIRTHRGAKEDAYQSVYQDIDEQGVCGVRLSKGLMKVAGDALKRNITTLGPLILPWSEQIKYLWSMIQRTAFKRCGKPSDKQPQPYVPNFKKAVEHFCIHAGGRAVVDAIQEALNLSDYDVEPSRSTLYRYGNTSSSSIWYELAFLERKGRIHRNQRVWQIAFGSGFKCNSCIWEAIM